MTNIWKRSMSMLLALVMVFSMVPVGALAAETEEPAAEVTEAAETEAPETEAPETEAPETEAPETEAPETEAPETEAPETEAPETEAPETEAPETEPVVTEPVETEPPVVEAAEEAMDAAIDSVELLQAALDEAKAKGETSYRLTTDLRVVEESPVLTIPEDMILYVDAHLTIPTGTDMEFEGNMVLSEGAVMDLYGGLGLLENGALEIYGTLNNWGKLWIYHESVMTICGGGALIIRDDEERRVAGIISCHGEWYIEDNGTLELCEGYIYNVGVTQTGSLVAGSKANIIANNTYIGIAGPDRVQGVAPEKLCIETMRQTVAEMKSVLAYAEQGYGRVHVVFLGEGGITDSLVIPKKAHVNVQAEDTISGSIPSSLTVKEGALLDVQGEFYLEDGCSLTVYGDVTAQNSFCVGLGGAAEMTVEEGGTLTNTGVFDVSVQGVLTVKGSMVNNGRMENNGWVDIYGTLDKGTNWNGIEPLIREGGQLVVAKMSQAELQDKIDEARAIIDAGGFKGVVLNKPVELEEDLVVSVPLYIEDGGELIVKSGAEVTVGKKIGYDCGSIDIRAGGKMVVEAGASLQVINSIYVYDVYSQDACLIVNGSYTLGEYGSIRVTAIEIDGSLTFAKVQGIEKEDLSADFDSCETLNTLKTAIDLAEDYVYVAVITYGLEIGEAVTIPENMELTIHGPSPWDPDRYTGIVHVTADGVLTIDGAVTMVRSTYEDGSTGQETVAEGTLKNDGRIIVNGRLFTDHGKYEGIAPEYNGINQDRLEAELAANGSATLTQELVLERDMILENTLTIVRGGHLIVPSGVTLTVAEGYVYFWEGGRLEVKKGGKLVNYGYIFQNDCWSDGYLKVDGTYTQKEDGFIALNVTNGRVATVEGISKSKLNLTGFAPNEETLRYALKQTGYRMIDISTYGMTLTDDLTIPANALMSVFYPHSEQESGDGILTVPAGKTLTVKGGLYIEVSNREDGTIKNTKLVNNGGVVVEKNGALGVYADWEGKAPVVKAGAYLYPEADSVKILGDEEILLTERVSELSLNVEVATAEYWGEGMKTLQMVTWTSSDKDVIDPAQIVDKGNGSYTMTIKGAGTTKLTATSIDGTKKTDSVTVEVTPVCPTNLELSVDGKAVEEVTLAKADEKQEFTIGLKAWDEVGEFALKADGVKWTSSDPDLAQVVSQDGKALVTVPAGAHGVAKLTATVLDELGASASLTLTVKDYSPRLGEKKVTLDAMSTEWVTVPLTASFDTDIHGVRFADQKIGDMVIVGYEPAVESLIFKADPEQSEIPANGKYTTKLEIDYIDKDGNVFTHTEDFTVTIKSSKISVTVKQGDKPAWNLQDIWVDLTLTAKAGDITDVVVESDDFEMRFYGEGEPAFGNMPTGGQYLELCYTQDYLDRALSEATPTKPVKPDTKVTLWLTVEGCAFPVKKDVTLKLGTEKTKLVANPTASVIKTNLEDQGLDSLYTISFDIREKGDAEGIDLSEDHGFAYIWEPEKWEYDEESREVSTSYKTPAKKTETLYVRLPYRLDYTKVTHKVSVSTKDPVLKLSSKTITLAKPMNVFGTISADLDQSNVALLDVTFKPEEKDGVLINYAAGEIYAQFDDSKGEPNNGSYKFEATPIALVNGEPKALKSVKITVKVADMKPKYKLSASTINLNTALNEVAEVTLSNLNDDALALNIVDFEGIDKHKDNVELTYEYGSLVAKRKSDKVGSYKYELCPIVENAYGEKVTLKNVKLKLTVKIHNKAVKVSQSAKGKLDTLNPESKLVYTIKSVSNMDGYVENVQVIGEQANRFQVTSMGLDAKNKLTFDLGMVPGAEYSTKESYQVSLRYTMVLGYDEEDAPITYEHTQTVSVKVTQGKLKAKAPKVTYFQSQGDLVTKLDLTAPENAAVGSVALNTDKTSKELLAALGEEAVGLIGQEGTTVWVKAAIDDVSPLKVGKTYKLVLDVTPVGLTKEGKATQVTISVKIAK